MITRALCIISFPRVLVCGRKLFLELSKTGVLLLARMLTYGKSAIKHGRRNILVSTPVERLTSHSGGMTKMADDRMKKDNLDKNMGGAGRHDQGDFNQGGQKTPGRNKQDDDLNTGQRGTGQQGEQKHIKDDFGTSEESDVRQGGRNL
jgi:hypothetical protein